MFQLIVAVIAIALVIALTLASIFYGGEAFTRSSLKANVAALVNQAQQISGAHTLYKTDKAKQAVSVADLVSSGYLADVPAAPSIASGSWGFVTTAGINTYVTIALDTNGAAATCAVISPTDGSQPQPGACANSNTTYQFPM